MLFGLKFCHWIQWSCQRPVLLVILVISVLLMASYLISDHSHEINTDEEIITKIFNVSSEYRKGFLVWNPKCKILDRDPFDQSILKFVKKENFEACRESALLTKIIRTSNGESILKIDQKPAKNYFGLSCCWAPILRPQPTEIPDPLIDSEVSIGSCTDFEDEVKLPGNVAVILVKCEAKNIGLKTKKGKKTVYENVHAVLQSGTLIEILKKRRTWERTRKLSVLILGMDNVSRLNFKRSMPETTSYLKTTGWTELKAYNKIADNTFPNLMAILTGLNITQTYQICSPTRSFGLDNCPLIWHAFRNASYVTAYGEDATVISTFDYMKTGFVNPPTDFYLRPYIIAAEKYLTSKRHLNTSHYCTGPELSGDRILNYALDFAKTFIGVPYFGFFWTNTMSHDNLNGPSSVDDHILNIIQRLDIEGILNDSMVIFLSDHGMRYGGIRETVQGWFEERLPFSYVWLPEWFKKENPKYFETLKFNGRSLTSPFNIYQTLRDVLIQAGGNADQSSGCPQCKSLFSPSPIERGCDDVGITHHWCACTAFGNGSIRFETVYKAAWEIVRHINNIVKKYVDSEKKRICTNLKLKQILSVKEMVDSQSSYSAGSNYKQFLCQIQVHPGNGKFEATIRSYRDGNITIVDNEISRINTYKKTAGCLDVGYIQYCFCE